MWADGFTKIMPNIFYENSVFLPKLDFFVHHLYMGTIWINKNFKIDLLSGGGGEAFSGILHIPNIEQNNKNYPKNTSFFKEPHHPIFLITSPHLRIQKNQADLDYLICSNDIEKRWLSKNHYFVGKLWILYSILLCISVVVFTYLVDFSLFSKQNFEFPIDLYFKMIYGFTRMPWSLSPTNESCPGRYPLRG